MTEAVFDTNVIVSGMLSPGGPPGRIVDWLIEGSIRAVFDDRIMDEYERVLHYPKLRLPGAEIKILIMRIAKRGVHICVTPRHANLFLPHEQDEAFAECALTAMVPLVTGNTRHFPTENLEPVPVLTPHEYVKALALATCNS